MNSPPLPGNRKSGNPEIQSGNTKARKHEIENREIQNHILSKSVNYIWRLNSGITTS